MNDAGEDRTRVLHVLAAFDPNEAQGCCASTIASLVEGEHLLACGSSVVGGTGPFASITETGAPLSRFGWSDRAELAEAVRRHRPDVVHFHGGPLGAATLSTRWTLGVPVVATIYGWPTVSHRSTGRGVSVTHLRRTPVMAPRTFGNTALPRSAVAAAMRRGGVRVVLTPDEAIAARLAHEAVPTATFRGVTAPAPTQRRRPEPGRFVFAGRAELTRGPDLLAEAVRRLRSRGRDVSAEFFFLGAHDTAMVRTATTAPGCTVTVGPADLARELRTATAMVLPFRFDTTTLAPALVATEAMAGGVPVVGGDVDCLRAAVDHRRTGLLVAPNDVESLCDALLLLADDPALVGRLGDGARREIDRRWRHSNLGEVAAWAYALATTTDHRPQRSAPVNGRARRRMEIT